MHGVIMIENTTFDENAALKDHGGSLYAELWFNIPDNAKRYIHLVINNSTFVNNFAHKDGGVIYKYSSNSIIEELNMYRTRVLVLKPKVCYSIHSDPVKRIHIPVITNENCWLIVNKEIMHLPADGRHYEIDTTQKHTALNGSWEDRIHIVGCIDNENISN